MKTITPDQLADTLVAEYMRYVKDISEIAEVVADEIAAEAKNMAETIGGYKDNSKALRRAKTKAGEKPYRKSFSVRKSRSSSGLIVSVTLVNSKYQLTHLLEYGHALKGGGRARAFPHWGPTESKYVKVYEQRLKTRIEREGRR